MMHLLTASLQQRIAREGAVLVRIDRTEGSAPREAGTWMIVLRGGEIVGTIGGGNVEHQAIAKARDLLASRRPLPRPREGGDPVAPSPAGLDPGFGGGDGMVHRYALGPSLGQCCGGVMHLRFESIGAQDLPTLVQRLAPALTPLALFGGGHVGKALVRVLSTLPYAVTWIDSRDGIFPGDVPADVRCEHSDPVQAAVADLAPGSQVLIMSFSHAEDLDIVAACLRRLREQDDLPFVGLIGSKTKWATFRHRLEARGYTADELARVTCPIGIGGINGKEPEVIAVSVAAQLLLRREGGA